MIKDFLKDAFGWGFLLWLIGYALGIILFPMVPTSLIGWIITPIGIVITLFILFKKIHKRDFAYYLLIGIYWSTIAIVCDYFFLVQIFKPADGYYKLDVYLYYAFTFFLPLFVGWRKSITNKQR